MSNPIYTVLGLHSFRTSAVIQTSRKQNRLQGFKPTLLLVLCFYSFMQKSLKNETNGVKEVNRIDLSNDVNFYNIERMDFFFHRNVRITIRHLEGKYQGTEAYELLSDYLSCAVLLEIM